MHKEAQDDEDEDGHAHVRFADEASEPGPRTSLGRFPRHGTCLEARSDDDGDDSASTAPMMRPPVSFAGRNQKTRDTVVKHDARESPSAGGALGKFCHQHGRS